MAPKLEKKIRGPKPKPEITTLRKIEQAGNAHVDVIRFLLARAVLGLLGDENIAYPKVDFVSAHSTRPYIAYDRFYAEFEPFAKHRKAQYEREYDEFELAQKAMDQIFGKKIPLSDAILPGPTSERPLFACDYGGIGNGDLLSLARIETFASSGRKIDKTVEALSEIGLDVGDANIEPTNRIIWDVARTEKIRNEMVINTIKPVLVQPGEKFHLLQLNGEPLDTTLGEIVDIIHECLETARKPRARSIVGRGK